MLYFGGTSEHLWFLSTMSCICLKVLICLNSKIGFGAADKRKEYRKIVSVYKSFHSGSNVVVELLERGGKNGIVSI